MFIYFPSSTHSIHVFLITPSFKQYLHFSFSHSPLPFLHPLHLPNCDGALPLSHHLSNNIPPPFPHPPPLLSSNGITFPFPLNINFIFYFPFRSTGLLAVVSPDESGFVQSRTTEVEHFDLAGRNSIFGRSIVVRK